MRGRPPTAHGRLVSAGQNGEGVDLTGGQETGHRPPVESLIRESFRQRRLGVTPGMNGLRR